jgi:hypothetical protein
MHCILKVVGVKEVDIPVTDCAILVKLFLKTPQLIEVNLQCAGKVGSD